MTLADENKKAAKKLSWLLEIEVAKRIDNLIWIQSGATDAYYTTPSDGYPERIREIDLITHDLQEYEEKGTQGDCESTPGSWYFDSATGRLYVNTTLSGGSSPDSGDFYITAYYWKCYCDGQYPAPNELVFNGKWYDPRLRLDSIPNLSMEISGFEEGGVRQTWSEMRLSNGDGAFDAALVDYIWENKIFILKTGVPGEAYASFVTVARGRTGSISWDDNEITIGVEDPMKGED